MDKKGGKGMARLIKRLRVLRNSLGQGATEYILLLVVVVGLAIALGPKIKKMVTNKLANVEQNINKVTP